MIRRVTVAEVSDTQIHELETMAKKIIASSPSARASRIDKDELTHVLVIGAWRYLNSGKYEQYVEKCRTMDEDAISESHMCYRRMVFTMKSHLADARQFVMSVPTQIKRQLAYNPAEAAVSIKELTGLSLDAPAYGTTRPWSERIATYVDIIPDTGHEVISQAITQLLQDAIDNETLEPKQKSQWWTRALEAGGVLDECPRLVWALGQLPPIEMQILVYHVLWQFPKHVTEQIMGLGSRDIPEITEDAKRHLDKALKRVPFEIDPAEYPEPHSVAAHTRLMQYTLFDSSIVPEVVASVDRFYNDLLTAQADLMAM